VAAVITAVAAMLCMSVYVCLLHTVTVAAAASAAAAEMAKMLQQSSRTQNAAESLLQKSSSYNRICMIRVLDDAAVRRAESRFGSVVERLPSAGVSVIVLLRRSGTIGTSFSL
jgi:hypothetical protein